METELKTIENNKTWSSVELPKNRAAIGCKWVYKIKQNETGESNRYKARLVAQGFTLKCGVDYDKVFAPVTRSSTFRTLLAVTLLVGCPFFENKNKGDSIEICVKSKYLVSNFLSTEMVPRTS